MVINLNPTLEELRRDPVAFLKAAVPNPVIIGTSNGFLRRFMNQFAQSESGKSGIQVYGTAGYYQYHFVKSPRMAHRTSSNRKRKRLVNRLWFKHLSFKP